MHNGTVSGRWIRPVRLAGGWRVLPGLMLLIMVAGSGPAAGQAAGEPAARARQLATQVRTPFAENASRLADLARESAIQGLFASADPIELAGRAAEYEDRFPASLNLRFFQPGGYTLDSSSRPPLSYACLALLRKTEKSNGAIGAEVHLHDGDGEHIVMVERVQDPGGQVLGLILLTLNGSLFAESLVPVTLNQAYVELRQSLDGQTLVLAKKGDTGLKQGSPQVTSVADTRWNLAYWGGAPVPAGDNTAEAAGNGLLLPTMLVAVLAGATLLAGAYLVYRRRRGSAVGPAAATANESVVYGGAVKNIMDGDHPGMETLVPDLPKGYRRDPDVKASPSEALTGADDITVMPGKQDRAAQSGAGKEVPKAKDAPTPTAKAATEPEPAATTEVDAGIFRAYDIRGVVSKTLTAEAVDSIGRAIGAEAAQRKEQAIVVGRDGRQSSPELAEALIKGLRWAGRDVIDIGVVPTPLLYYATHTLQANSGVMVTGSHNGPEYNGLKIVLAGETLSEQAIQAIRKRIVDGDLKGGSGGKLGSADVIADYVRRVSEDIPVALGSAYKLVVDCGNGVAGAVAPQLYRALGHDVIELYCEVDGRFPNHHPDPSQPENLEALIDKVKSEGADLGFAFDGDGDRLGVVDSRGNVIWPDRQLMILARDVLGRNAGAEIIFDVKCSRYLKQIIEDSGGKPLMWKTGHSLIKAKMKEVDAPLAGEMSGHIFFKERWYGFDDALYTGARLLEILVQAKADPVAFFAAIPEGVSTPELRVDLIEEQHQGVMQQLEQKLDFEGAEVIKVDGLRVEFADGWGLIRPSNTSPCLVLRFEADDEAALTRIQGQFREVILSINPELQLPF